MSLVAAAVCPHRPPLVADLATGAASARDSGWVAAGLAAHRLVSASADRLLAVVGRAGTFTAGNAENEFWSDHGIGMSFSSASGMPALPRIAAWLLGRVDVARPASTLMSVLAVSEEVPAAECAAPGAEPAGAYRPGVA